MGLFSKKKTTTQTQNTSFTQTPTNPQWVTDSISGLSDKIGQTFGGFDPSKLYGGPNPLQTQAAGAAAGLKASPLYGAAADIFGKVSGAPANTYSASTYDPAMINAQPNMKGASLLDGLSSYMNPYTNDVAGAALADYDFGSGMTRAQNKLALAGDETFGGSGGAIQTALSEDAINRGRGALSAGLRSDAFDKGAALSSQDADRRQAADLTNVNLGFNRDVANAGATNAARAFGADAFNTAGAFNAGQQDNALARALAGATGLTNTANTQNANERDNIATQGALGGVLRDITNQQNGAPLEVLLKQIAAQTGLPLSMFTGQTGTGNMNGVTKSKESGASLSDWLGFFSANAQTAAKAGAGG